MLLQINTTVLVLQFDLLSDSKIQVYSNEQVNSPYFHLNTTLLYQNVANKMLTNSYAIAIALRMAQTNVMFGFSCWMVSGSREQETSLCADGCWGGNTL
jgi:hypothetical protein